MHNFQFKPRIFKKKKNIYISVRLFSLCLCLRCVPSCCTSMGYVSIESPKAFHLTTTIIIIKPTIQSNIFLLFFLSKRMYKINTRTQCTKCNITFIFRRHHLLFHSQFIAHALNIYTSTCRQAHTPQNT